MTFGWSRSHSPMRVPERHRAVTPDRTGHDVSSGSRGGEWALPAMVCGVLALLLVAAGAGTSLGWWTAIAAAVLAVVTVVYLGWPGRLELSRLFTTTASAEETSLRSGPAGEADQPSTQSAGSDAAGADTRPDPSQRTRVERRSAGPVPLPLPNRWTTSPQQHTVRRCHCRRRGCGSGLDVGKTPRLAAITVAESSDSCWSAETLPAAAGTLSVGILDRESRLLQAV